MTRINAVRLLAAVTAGVSSFVAVSIGATVTAQTSPETSQVDLIGPPGSVDFGRRVLVLSNGNYVVTDPDWSTPAADRVGAVHLYDGRTNLLISTLTGSQESDVVGLATPVEVGDSNFVVPSLNWDNGDERNAGAATWVSGESGLNGEVSPGNSLVGTVEDDLVGQVVALAGGNFAVVSSDWSGGPIAARGAVTWAPGDAGIIGPVTSANSLVGTNAGDEVGDWVQATSGGDLLVRSRYWDNAGVLDAGAITLIDGGSGLSGAVSSANSLVGSQDDDEVGNEGAVELTNGNLVAVSTRWANGSESFAGAVTWIDPAVGTAGVVSEANSLVGSGRGDVVGGDGVVALANGNYVVASPEWEGDGSDDRGAYTWGDGSLGATGVVSEANSFVGAPDDDGEVFSSVTPLDNGNYVVAITTTDLGGFNNVGSVTWGNGTTGLVGTPDATNSLVGSRPDDWIGTGGVTPLVGGNYVVASPSYDVATFFSDAGAVTWGDGDSGVAGAVSVGNSLVASSSNRRVGSGGVTALANGNYVVASPEWYGISATTHIGAVTWGSGATGVTGTVGTGNSVVGVNQDDAVGSRGVIALADGAFVIESPGWDSFFDNVGAVTWFDGTGPITGAVTATNSLVGARPDAETGSRRTVALADGSYVVYTAMARQSGGGSGPVWTWRSGGAPQPGAVDEDNSFDTVSSIVIVADPDDAARQIEPGAFLLHDSLFGGDRGAVSFAASGAGLVGQPNALRSAIGRPPGSVFSPSTRLTRGDAIAVPTSQNRVLLLQLDREPQFADVVDVGGIGVAGASTSAVEFTAPVADDVRDGPIESACVPGSGSEFPVGDTNVTCTATDSKGQSSSTMFTVTVTVPIDPPPPEPEPVDDPDVVSVEPARLLDTRESGETVDDRFEKTGKVAAGSFVELDVAGRAGVPSDAGSVVLNVTMIRPDGNGFVTIYPCDVARPLASSMNAPAGGGVVANEVIAKVSPTGTVCLYSSVGTNLAADVVGFVPDGSDVVSVEPARLLDTRGTGETVDDLFEQTGNVAAAGVIELDVAGRAGVPSDAGSVVLNVTMVRPDGNGFVTIYPCDVARPLASSMNAPAGGGVVANEVIAKVSAEGTVCLYSSVGTNLAADVTGYVAAGSDVSSVEPARLLDTRATGETTDDLFEKTGKVAADSFVELGVFDRGGVPTDGVGAVVLNVTMIRPEGNGFVTISPCDVARPLASSMNAPSGGGVVANEVIAKVSATGTVCLYSSVGTNLAADVTGYIAT